MILKRIWRQSCNLCQIRVINWEKNVKFVFFKTISKFKIYTCNTSSFLDFFNNLFFYKLLPFDRNIKSHKVKK